MYVYVSGQYTLLYFYWCMVAAAVESLPGILYRTVRKIRMHSGSSTCVHYDGRAGSVIYDYMCGTGNKY